jgi:cytoskeletal protein CcmA (bactofilin family)
MTTIGRAVIVSGTIEAEEPVSIAGTIMGDVLASNHDVVVEEQARVEGAVTGKTITIHGNSVGRLIARDVVRIHLTARVYADIAAPKVILEDGAVFNGSVEPARTAAALIVAAYRKRIEARLAL